MGSGSSRLVPKGYTCIYYYQQLSEGSAGVRVSEANWMMHKVAFAMKIWDMYLPLSRHFVQGPPAHKQPSEYCSAQAPRLETTTPTRQSQDRSLPCKPGSARGRCAPCRRQPPRTVTPKPQPLLRGAARSSASKCSQSRQALLKAGMRCSPGLRSQERGGRERDKGPQGQERGTSSLFLFLLSQGRRTHPPCTTAVPA